jgi:hypothetical protein
MLGGKGSTTNAAGVMGSTSDFSGIPELLIDE